MFFFANSASKAPKKATTESVADGNKIRTKRKATSVSENGRLRVIHRFPPELTSANLNQRPNAKNDSNLLQLPVGILAELSLSNWTRASLQCMPTLVYY